MANSRKVSECLSKIHAAQRELVPCDRLILKQLCDQLLNARSPRQHGFLQFSFNSREYYPVLQAFCQDVSSFETNMSLRNKIIELNQSLSTLSKSIGLNSELAAIVMAYFFEYPDACDPQSLPDGTILKACYRSAEQHREQRRAETLQLLLRRAASKNKTISQTAQKELLGYISDNIGENKSILQAFIRFQQYDLLKKVTHDPRVNRLLSRLLLEEFTLVSQSRRVQYCRILGDSISGSTQKQYDFFVHLLADPDDELVICAFESLCKIVNKNLTLSRIELIVKCLKELIDVRFRDKPLLVEELHRCLPILSLDDDQAKPVLVMLFESAKYGCRTTQHAAHQALLKFVHVPSGRNVVEQLLNDIVLDESEESLLDSIYDLIESVGTRYGMNDRLFDSLVRFESRHPEFLSKRFITALQKMRLSNEQKNKLYSVSMKQLITMLSTSAYLNHAITNDESEEDAQSDQPNKIILPPSAMMGYHSSQRLGFDLVQHVRAICLFASNTSQLRDVYCTLRNEFVSQGQQFNSYDYHADHDQECLKQLLASILTVPDTHSDLDQEIRDFILGLFDANHRFLSQNDLIRLLSNSSMVLTRDCLQQLLLRLSHLLNFDQQSMDHCVNISTLQNTLGWLASMPVSSHEDRESIAAFVCYMTKHTEQNIRLTAYNMLSHICQKSSLMSEELQQVIDAAFKKNKSADWLAGMSLIPFITDEKVKGKYISSLAYIAVNHDDKRVQQAACDYLIQLASKGSYQAAESALTILLAKPLFVCHHFLAELIINHYDSVLARLNSIEKKAFIARSKDVIECLKILPSAHHLRRVLEMKCHSYVVLSSQVAPSFHSVSEPASSSSLVI
jgi:hypothetical protein